MQILESALEVGPIRIGHDLVDVALVRQFPFGGRISLSIPVNRWVCIWQIDAKPEERIGATIHILVVEYFGYWSLPRRMQCPVPPRYRYVCHPAARRHLEIVEIGTVPRQEQPHLQC